MIETPTLVERAKSVRREIVKFKTSTGNGHLASSLSLVDILVSLYYDEQTNFVHERDTIIFSKAHGGPAVYPILADLGYFSPEELKKYCRPGGILRLHTDKSIPGCEFVGGSLGNALGYIAGLAWANRHKNYIIILGDAELYEGSIWESLIFIAHEKLKNLLIIVDRNGLGILGETEKLLKLEPLLDKFISFGFNTTIIDGHNFDEMRDIFSISPLTPSVVIAKTVKAKGIPFMENKAEYHTIIPRDKEVITQILENLT